MGPRISATRTGRARRRRCRRSAGCNALQFAPSMRFTPETTQADSPSGYTFDLSVPQFSDPNGLATPPLKRATVTLPEGVSVSPSAADGLQACSDAQFDVGSIEPAVVSVCLAGRDGDCEDADPERNRDGPGVCGLSRTARRAARRMPRRAACCVCSCRCRYPARSLKFPGTVSVDPVTGRLTATFAGLIQQPVSDIQLQFKGGPRAPLANPRGCGTFTSDERPGTVERAVSRADGTPSSSFATTGVVMPAQFAPSFLAGTASNQAGGFSPFSVSVSRSDADQELGSVAVNIAAGAAGDPQGRGTLSRTAGRAGRVWRREPDRACHRRARGRAATRSTWGVARCS